MKKALLKLNYFIWKEYSEMPEVIAFIILALASAIIGLFLAGGITLKVPGVIIGIAVLASRGLYAFGMGKE